MKHCFLLLAAMLMIQFAVAQALDIDRLWMDHTYVRGTDCQIRNGLLYVTNDRIADQSAPGLDLIIFDLSDPQRIAALSYLDLDAPPSIALALCASRAVVIHDNGLLSTIDTTDPVLPVFVAAVQNPASIVAHQVLGSYLYVYDNDGYLRCYSMIGLDLLASLWIGSGYESMAFCGTRAYLSGTAPGFRCLDITEPTAPTDLGTIGNAVGLQITASYNDTLICKDTYGSVVRFYDVSSPSTALLVLTWTPNMQVGLMRMDADAGNLVIYTEGYLSDYYENYLVIWDLSGYPQIINVQPHYSLVKFLGLYQDTLLLLSPGNTFDLYNLTDTGLLQWTGNLFGGLIFHVDANSSKLFANVGFQGLNIYDLDTPAPELFCRLTNLNSKSMEVTDQILLLNKMYDVGVDFPSYNSIQIYTLPETGPPLPASYSGSFGISGTIGDIQLHGARVYLFSANQFEIYNVSDFSNPVEEFSLSGRFTGMAIRGHYAYLVNYQNGWRLQIYDVSQSSSIQLVGELPLNSNHSATHIRLVGNILFLGAQYITLIDVSNPGAPSLISQYDFSFSVRDLATASNALIVLNSFELSVYDISSPLDPQLVASTTLGSRALDMVLRDGKAYVGHYDYVACYDLSEALAICAASGIGNDVPPPEPGIYCYPNPFQGSAILRVDLKEPGSYELTIYNLRGQPVRRFTDLISQNGSSTLIWNGEDDKGKPLPSGIYLVNAQNGKQSLRSKLILMK